MLPNAPLKVMVFLNSCKVLLFLVLAVVGASGVVHNLGDSTFDDFVDNLPEHTLLLVDFYKVSLLACVGSVLCPALQAVSAHRAAGSPPPALTLFRRCSTAAPAVLLFSAVCCT